MGGGHFLVSHSISLRLSFLICRAGLKGLAVSQDLKEDWVGMRRVKGLTGLGPTMADSRYAETHIRGSSILDFRGGDSGGLETDSSWGWGRLLGSVCAPGLGGRGECGDGAKE